MEAWDLPIKGNPLVTRADLEKSLGQLMEPLLDRFVNGNAGLHLGNSAALFDDRTALMEGMSRLLWGLAPLAARGEVRGAFRAESASAKAIEKIKRGLVEGSDPASPHYWGVGGDRDQRFVEMAAMALSLLIAPKTFWEPLEEKQKANLAAWLTSINEVELPPTNWEFFRVLVNLALRRLGRPFGDQRLAAGLATIDGLYREDGWYQDDSNYDLYNPFAFHFYGLVYAKLCADEDPDRCARYRERARLFARQYLPWFTADGSSVPFGRSLCYRFAAVSFFSACAFAGEEVIPWGAMRNLALSHLRHWFSLPIFDHEGILTIGYAYPNLIMAEQYNSPGSPYWALKAYLLLALPDSHPFWASASEDPPPALPVSLNAPPKLLLCRAGKGDREHVYCLNAGQYPSWESVHAAAKYAKFAYSNRFGFCVSHGSYDLSKTGCDSSLLFSEGDGYWRERRQSRDRFSCADYVYSAWDPWNGVRVGTWLIPCGEWHIRIHSIESDRELETVEGGFSLPDASGAAPPARPSLHSGPEGGIIASMPWAFGGILDLRGERKGELHKPEPNLNVLHPKVFIPILRGRIAAGKSILACAVIAGMGSDEASAWSAPPVLEMDESTGRARITSGRLVIAIDLHEPGKNR